jgi:hypothetical protein
MRIPRRHTTRETTTLPVHSLTDTAGGPAGCHGGCLADLEVSLNYGDTGGDLFTRRARIRCPTPWRLAQCAPKEKVKTLLSLHP